MNPLDLVALSFCPVGPGYGFWAASDRLHGGAATNRALWADTTLDA
jgi:hypothetical protein